MLDSLTIKVRETGVTILSITDWDRAGKDFKAVFTQPSGEQETYFYSMFLGASDLILGTNFADQITAMGGNDTVNAGGGNDEVWGDGGADRLNGGAGSDTLQGGAGNNWLAGGTGADTLVGGSGADRFLFNTAPSLASADLVVDFDAASDLILLDNDIFAAIGAVGTLRGAAFHNGTDATTAAQRIIYDITTGNLWYDKDGTGSAAKVLVADMDGGPILTAADFQIID